MKFKTLLKSRKTPLIIISLVTLFAYINIFQNQFHFDDPGFIVNWQETHTWNFIPDFFKGLVPPGHGGIYRPLRSVLYTVSYHIWGGENTFGYHLQSILIITFTSWLIYLITEQITKNKLPAFIASILFGLHPVHTEAITFMTASFDSIGSVLFFLAFYLYLKALNANKNNFKLYLASSVSATMAFFIYEITLTLLLLILLYLAIFQTVLLKKLKTYLIYGLFYVLPALAYTFIRVYLLHITKRGDYLEGSIFVTFLTMIRAFLKYLEVLVFPVNLNVNHNLGPGIHAFMWAESKKAAILSQSIFDPVILSGLVILVSLVMIAILLVKKHSIISFTIGWFFISLSPVSDIIPQATIMAEKYLFIPSFGFVLAVACLFSKLYSKFYFKTVLIIILAAVAVSYFVLTIQRNADWKNGISLWTSAVKDAPESIYNRNNLGSNYANRKNFDLAIIQFKKIVELNPKNDNAYRQLALAHQDQGNFDLAEEYAKKLISLNTSFPTSYNLLGSIYQKQGKFDLAEEQYQKAVEVSDKKDATAYYNLGSLYAKQENITQAIAEYQEALKLDPNSADTHTNLGVIYLNQKKLDLAIEELQKAIALNPKQQEAYYNLGKAFEEKGDIKEALKQYFQAKEIDDNFADVHLNLGVIYAKSYMFDLAIEEFVKVISLKPSYAEAYFNLGLAYQALEKKQEAKDALRKGLAIKPEPQIQLALDELTTSKP